MTKEAFAPVIELARRLERGVADVIIKHGLDWHVTRVGTRVEFMCCPTPPKNGFEASKLIHKPIDAAVHQFLLNRGVIITPFHNMMLVCPATTEHHVTKLVATLDECLTELTMGELLN
jgi:glutamate-1-semialdehyde 2,1-aminomutase